MKHHETKHYEMKRHEIKQKTCLMRFGIAGICAVLGICAPAVLRGGKKEVRALAAEAAAEGDYAYIQELIDAGELTAAELIDTGALEGWAATAGEGLETTTGGGDCTPVLATEFFQFWELVEDNEPRVVIVAGEIRSPRDDVPIEIGSNKTIVGIDADTTFYGGLEVKNAENVIISNLNIHGGWYSVGSDDTVSVRGSHHIWLDHLNVWDGRDGNMDLVMGVDYITVSWCKFWYSSDTHEHRLSNLVGSGTGHDDTDKGKLNVTYHHCWFGANCDQRMPRFLYGKGHAYNNYYDCEGNSYCIASACYAEVLIENNYFKNVKNPHRFMYTNALPASIYAEGNIYDGTTGSKSTGIQGPNNSATALFIDPPYAYTLDAAEDVPDMVTAGAGPHDIVENPNKPDDVPTEEPTKEPGGGYARGDVDADGSVTASDALSVLQAVVKLNCLDEEQTWRADVTGDGAVAADDALVILRYVVKLVGAL